MITAGMVRKRGHAGGSKQKLEGAFVFDNGQEQPGLSASATFRAVIGRIVPADQDPGALELGADGYVVARLGENEALTGAIGQGLADLDVLAGGQFAQLPPDRQNELLTLKQNSSWFSALVELTAEGFYADPANGGNRDGLSWRMIGYQHRLPEGPNGPMPQAETDAGHAS